MSSVVIVPGLHNSGPQHWQSLWQRRLPNSVRVEQARWDVPDLQRWSDNVLRVLNDLDQRGEDCWIVAYSFGCLASVFALVQASASTDTQASLDTQVSLNKTPAKHLSKNRPLSNVRGIFLVAPADPQKFAVADVLPAGPLQVAGRMVASRSDPWLAWTQAEQWARRWQLQIIDAGHAGHINAESGHGYWPEGWREFQQLCNTERRATPQRYLALAV
jgi:serine hydrolase